MSGVATCEGEVSDLAEPVGYLDLAVTRHAGPGERRDVDQVAQEWPVALVFNGISHAVMMSTPLDLEALAVGFALTEGIVAARHDIHDVEVHVMDESAHVDITIGHRAFHALKGRRRALEGRSGCGVCGIESLELLDLRPQPSLSNRVRPTMGSIARASEALSTFQVLGRITGALHAAAWCAPDGSVLAIAEDVGRHNALDKLIGGRILAGGSFSEGFVFMSSRASYELARKAARVGIPMLATVSAPTTLAVKVAQQAGLALASFCRGSGFVEYTV